MPSNETEQIQYIGARYITKIYENSQNPSSAEWEAQVNYEPLTLVTYQNSTYLSRSVVPKNIGNPADNGTYWALTGAYNGQIASLQNQIDAINNVAIPAVQGNVDTINNVTIPAVRNEISVVDGKVANINARLARKIIVITDSYGTVENGAFGTALAAKIKKTLDADLIFLTQGSSGFIGISPAPTFLEQLQAYENDNTFDKTEITDVVVVGGTNDRGNTKADIQASIGTFNTHITTNYPNAIIHIGFISRSTVVSHMYDIRNTVLESYIDSALYFPKTCYISNAQTWLPYDYISADTLHPTGAGCGVLAWCLGNYLCGKTVEGFAFNYSGSVTFGETGISPSMSTTIAIERHGTDIDVNISPILLQLTGMVGNSFADGVKIGTSTQKYVNAVSYSVGSIPCTVMARLKDSNNVETWYYCDARLMIRLDGIYLKFNAPFDLNALTLNALYFINGVSGKINPFDA